VSVPSFGTHIVYHVGSEASMHRQEPERAGIAGGDAIALEPTEYAGLSSWMKRRDLVQRAINALELPFHLLM
jgi:hypothetical protein